MDKTRIQNARRTGGAALIIAVSLLAIFVTLGAFYVRNMSLELDKMAYAISAARAREIARAGVYAAIGDLQRAAAEGQLGQLLSKPREYAFPVYAGVRSGTDLALAPMENRVSEATVSITDESGKMNLNHAPASVLQRLLGIDGAAARRITSSLPRLDGSMAAGQEGGWMLAVQDLLTRGFLTQEQFEALNKDLFTVWSVSDHTSPAGFLNVNAAPVEVLAAILDMPIEHAQAVADQRPFASFSALAQAAGKDPAAFNIKPDPGDPSLWPGPLTSESHCFRIVSEGMAASTAGDREYNRAVARVEAVLLIRGAQSEIVYWNAAANSAAGA